MEVLKFCILGFGIYTLRILLFPINLILLILMTPGYFILRDKESEKYDKFLDFFDDTFMRIFGPPFGFFSAALAFYVGLVMSFWIM